MAAKFGNLKSQLLLIPVLCCSFGYGNAQNVSAERQKRIDNIAYRLTNRHCAGNYQLKEPPNITLQGFQAHVRQLDAQLKQMVRQNPGIHLQADLTSDQYRYTLTGQINRFSVTYYKYRQMIHYQCDLV